MIIEGTILIEIEDGDIPADGHFTIPPHITAIGDRAFKRCTKLTAVTFNEDLIQIGACAFIGCAGLTTVIFNEGLAQIGSYVFSGCTGLTAVTFNKNLKYIGDYVFWGCTQLIAVTFNEQLTDIGRWAFADCTNIKDIVIATISKEVYDRIEKLLPDELKEQCMEMSVYEQLSANLLAIRTEVLRGILAEPVTNPLRRYAKSLSNFDGFPDYADFGQVMNQVDPGSNLFYNKAKRLTEVLPLPVTRTEQGLAAYRDQCQEIVKVCLSRAKSGFFASSVKSGISQESVDLSPFNITETLCETINIGP